jgi:hypothetical protein
MQISLHGGLQFKTVSDPGFSFPTGIPPNLQTGGQISHLKIVSLAQRNIPVTMGQIVSQLTFFSGSNCIQRTTTKYFGNHLREFSQTGVVSPNQRNLSMPRFRCHASHRLRSLDKVTACVTCFWVFRVNF